MLANLSLFLLQKVTALEATAGNGVPYWMYVCFMIGTVCILLTVLTAMARTHELTPSDEELAEMRPLLPLGDVHGDAIDLDPLA